MKRGNPPSPGPESEPSSEMSMKRAKIGLVHGALAGTAVGHKFNSDAIQIDKSDHTYLNKSDLGKKRAANVPTGEPLNGQQVHVSSTFVGTDEDAPLGGVKRSGKTTDEVSLYGDESLSIDHGEVAALPKDLLAAPAHALRTSDGPQTSDVGLFVTDDDFDMQDLCNRSSEVTKATGIKKNKNVELALPHIAATKDIQIAMSAVSEMNPNEKQSTLDLLEHFCLEMCGDKGQQRLQKTIRRNGKFPEGEFAHHESTKKGTPGQSFVEHLHWFSRLSHRKTSYNTTRESVLRYIRDAIYSEDRITEFADQLTFESREVGMETDRAKNAGLKPMTDKQVILRHPTRFPLSMEVVVERRVTSVHFSSLRTDARPDLTRRATWRLHHCRKTRAKDAIIQALECQFVRHWPSDRENYTGDGDVGPVLPAEIRQNLLYAGAPLKVWQEKIGKGAWIAASKNTPSILRAAVPAKVEEVLDLIQKYRPEIMDYFKQLEEKIYNPTLQADQDDDPTDSDSEESADEE